MTAMVGCLRPTATAAEEAVSPTLASAENAGGSDDPDAPNLLGGAYESSEDEEGPTPGPPATAAVAATAGASTAPAAAPAAGGMQPPLAAGGGTGSVAAGQGEGKGGRSTPSPLAPGEEKRQVVEKMVGYVAKNGHAFEDRVRNR